MLEYSFCFGAVNDTMISKADIAAFCRDVVYGKVKGKKMMLKKKGLAVRRILALILVLFLVGTTTPAGQERVVYGAAATPVSRHGRLSVKGADLGVRRIKKKKLGDMPRSEEGT